jgi:hypothetical protein
MFFGSLGDVLTFLYKIAVRRYRYYRSSDWQKTTAYITGQIPQLPIWGCASVRLHYKFDFNGEITKGSDVVPFRFSVDAKSWAESFTDNLAQTIRVNPENPQESYYFERDQNS